MGGWRLARPAVMPYRPLALGRLARDASETTRRLETDQIAKRKYDASADADRFVIERLAEVANKHGVRRAQIAFAWLLHQKLVVAPVVGATKIPQLETAVASLSVKSTAGEIAYMEAPYTPHPIVGHS